MSRLLFAAARGARIETRYPDKWITVVALLAMVALFFLAGYLT